MNNETNQSKVHEEVLVDINKQLNRISEIEQREQECVPKKEPRWKNFVKKILGKIN
jgi:hypothetical protein